MPYTKKIVCLANSWRHPSGICIAGKEVLDQGFGPWVRPVSERSSRELSKGECSYSNGQAPGLLDIVEINLERQIPEGHQKENHLHNDDYYWGKKGVCDWNKLQSAIDEPDGPLWYNNSASNNGINDRVPRSYTRHLESSLYLIKPEGVILKIQNETTAYGYSRLRVRAYFEYKGEEYLLAVTDPQINNRYCYARYDDISLSNVLVCISLGEVFYGYAYKLVAGIIEKS